MRIYLHMHTYISCLYVYFKDTTVQANAKARTLGRAATAGTLGGLGRKSYAFEYLKITTHICVCIHTYTCMCICIHTHAHIYIYVCVHIYIYIYICIGVCIHRRIYTYIHV